MEYCILNAEGVIENIIVSDAAFAETLGLLPAYDGAAIGTAYAPPAPEPDPPTEEEDLAAMAVDHEYRLTLLELGLTEEV